jgi:hypothetical protein
MRFTTSDFFSQMDPMRPLIYYLKICYSLISNSTRFSNSKFYWPLYNTPANSKKCLSKTVFNNGPHRPWVVHFIHGWFLFDCSFIGKGRHSKFLPSTVRYFKLLAPVICGGKIWCTATYLAASFD